MITALLAGAILAPTTGVVLLHEPSLIGLPTASGEPEYIRNQLSRGSCTMMAAVAAMEYAVFKTYGEVVDLSEQFTAHVGKSNYLHAFYEDILPHGPYRLENQVAGTAGGEYLGGCFDGLPMTAESLTMPFTDPVFSPPLGDPFWDNQYNVHSYNMHVASLPVVETSRDVYYQATGFRRLAAGNSPEEMETVLDDGQPISWDFIYGGNTTGEIWDPHSGPTIGPGHAMLIIGYDNRGFDDDKKFIYVKNSWGPTPYLHGLTKVSYAYVRRFGSFARTISGAMKVQSNYPYMGLWRMTSPFADRTLAVAHLPGTSKQDWTYFGRPDQVDHRLGSVYDSVSPPTLLTPAWRINGEVGDKGVRFHYSDVDPNQPYWETVRPTSELGWLSKTRSPAGYSYLAGFTRNVAGKSFATVANKLGYGSSTLGAVGDATTMPGQWSVYVGDDSSGVMTIHRSASSSSTANMKAALRLGGNDYVGIVRLMNPASILTGGPFTVADPMWVVTFTNKELGLAPVTLVMNKAVPSRMLFAGLTPNFQGVVARQIVAAP